MKMEWQCRMVDQLAIWIQGAYQPSILFRVGWFKQMYGWE